MKTRFTLLLFICLYWLSPAAADQTPKNGSVISEQEDKGPVKSNKQRLSEVPPMCEGFSNNQIWKLNDKIWRNCLKSIKSKMPQHKALIEQFVLNALDAKQPVKRVYKFTTERYKHKGWSKKLINMDDVVYRPQPKTFSETQETLAYLFELHSLSWASQFARKTLEGFYKQHINTQDIAKVWHMERDFVLDLIHSDKPLAFNNKLTFMKTFKLYDPIAQPDGTDSYVFETFMNGPVLQWLEDSSVVASNIAKQSCKPLVNTPMNIMSKRQSPLVAILALIERTESQSQLFSKQSSSGRRFKQRLMLSSLLKGCFTANWRIQEGEYRGGNFLHLLIGSELPASAKQSILSSLMHDDKETIELLELTDKSGQKPIDIFIEKYFVNATKELSIEGSLLFSKLYKRTTLTSDNLEKVRLAPNYQKASWTKRWLAEYRAQKKQKIPSGKLITKNAGVSNSAKSSSAHPCKHKQKDADAIIRVLKKLRWLRGSEIKSCIVAFGKVYITFKSAEIADWNPRRNMLTFYKNSNDAISRNGNGYCYDPTLRKSFRQKTGKLCWD